MPTLDDIARETGVSTSTVSRALAGSRLIDASLAERIQQKAEDLGYRRRRVKRPRTRTILNVKLVLPRFSRPELQLFYDFQELCAGLYAGVAPTTVQLVTDLAEPAYDPLAHKKGGHLDAVVFAFFQPEGRIYQRLDDAGIPHLTLHRTPEGHPFITGDDHAGFDLLVQHLVTRRPELRPLFIRIASPSPIPQQRQNHLAAACEAHGVRFDPETDFLLVDEIAQIDASALKNAVASGYNAFVCMNDVVAAAVLQRTAQASLSVPGDVFVTGYDNAPIRSIVSPALTTINLPVRTFGKHAGQWLVEALIEKTTPPIHEFLAPTLLKGATT